MPEELEEVRGRVADIERQRGALSRPFEEPIPYREQIRWRLTRVILFGYVIAVGAVIVYVILDGWRSGQSRFVELLDIIKVAMLPVVTFVIGYYFGSRSN